MDQALLEKGRCGAVASDNNSPAKWPFDPMSGVSSSEELIVRRSKIKKIPHCGQNLTGPPRKCKGGVARDERNKMPSCEARWRRPFSRSGKPIRIVASRLKRDIAVERDRGGRYAATNGR